MRTLLIVSILSSLLLVACSDDPVTTGTDAGTVADTGTGGNDATVTDSAVIDVPTVDLSVVDAALTDLGGADMSVPDLGVTDLGVTDLGAADADVCTPPTVDGTNIGLDCETLGAADPSICGLGYDCLEFSGIVVQYTCEIQCDLECGTTECPSGHSCISVFASKSGDMHNVCRPFSDA